MLPTGPQFGGTFVLTGPDGSRAVFNDQSDTDYVGVLTEVTGLDSPDVRENGADNVGADGGIHGDFFYGRRPVTLTGRILNPASTIDRNERATQLMLATNALRADSVLTWTPDGGVPSFLSLRRQQPLRITGGWQKEFQVGMVAADPRIYSVVLHGVEGDAVAAEDTTGRSYDLTYDKDYGPATPNGQVIVENLGNADTWPILTITGPGSNPSIHNLTTGQSIYLGYTLGTAETLILDTLNRSVMLNGQTSRYGALDFDRSEWFPLVAGINDIRIAFNTFATGAKLRVDWRDAWL